jgi:hypothetical protein
MKIYTVKFRASRTPRHWDVDMAEWTVASFSCLERAVSFLKSLESHFHAMELEKERLSFDWDNPDYNEIDLHDDSGHVASELYTHGKLTKWDVPRCPKPFMEAINVIA